MRSFVENFFLLSKALQSHDLGGASKGEAAITTEGGMKVPKIEEEERGGREEEEAIFNKVAMEKLERPPTKLEKR